MNDSHDLLSLCRCDAFATRNGEENLCATAQGIIAAGGASSQQD